MEPVKNIDKYKAFSIGAIRRSSFKELDWPKMRGRLMVRQACRK